MSETLTGRDEKRSELEKVGNLVDDSGALEVERAVEKVRPARECALH